MRGRADAGGTAGAGKRGGISVSKHDDHKTRPPTRRNHRGQRPPSHVEMLTAVQLKLWSAAEEGDAAEVRRCLNAGANQTITNRFGWNALHRACMSGNVECVEPLLPVDDDAARAKMLATADGAGNFPLHIAAGCGHRGVVDVLLRSGAAVDAATATPKDGSGGGSSEMDTPMHSACKALADAQAPHADKLLDVVVALIANGGLLEATDARGRMAASYLPKPMQQKLLLRIRPAPAAAPPSDPQE